MPPRQAYLIIGTVYESIGFVSKSHTIDTGLGGVTLDLGGGTIVSASRTVTFTNATTGESATVTTDNSGIYGFDANNFTSGYTNGDVITITTDFVDNVDDYPLRHTQTKLTYREAARSKGVTLFDESGFNIEKRNPLQVDMVLSANIKSQAVTVSTSAVKLPATSMEGRRSILIFDNSTTIDLYIGGSDVTTTNGIPITAKSTITIDANEDVDVYGIASESINVRVLEMS